MGCPRCGFEASGGTSCPRCGVVFAKLRESPARRPIPQPAPEAPPGTSSFWTKVALGLLLLGIGAVGVHRMNEPPAPPPSPTHGVPGDPPAARDSARAEGSPPLVPPPASTPQRPADEAAPAGLSEEDARLANDLARRLDGPASGLGSAELRRAEDLLARHGEEPGIRRLAAAVFATLAAHERERQRPDEAVGLVQRAVAADGANRHIRTLQVTLLLESGDWRDAEAAARALLELEPGDRQGLWSLGYSLFRQDRNREAIEVLREAVAAGDEGQAKALLARLEKGARDERGMTEQQLAHFHVRYDGDAHEDVGREILRALERHYATLVLSLDHQPSQPIPVILFSTKDYHDATGAPAWSGGVYDTLDGRIRVPIGGLTTSLTPDMDGTLIHELTHAFVHDLSRGRAARNLHEGLAQYMEGKRLAASLSPEDLKALADGRMGGVSGFYLEALGFVEYLVALRGMGGIKDLLAGMAASQSDEGAFQQVYGKGSSALGADARSYLRSRYGS